MLKNLETFDLINLSYATQAISSLIQLDVFDTLALGKLDPAQLAQRIKADQEKLVVLLNVAVSMDFLGMRDSRYYLKKKGLRLTRSVNGWEREYFLVWAGGIAAASQNSKSWVLEDINAYQAANGHTIWNHYRIDRALGSTYEKFQDRISTLAHMPALTQKIELPTHTKFLDVAGGKGVMAIHLARHNENVVGAVLDQPHMRSAFESCLAQTEEPNLEKRLSFIEGNMLQSIPAGYDTYLIKHALHDWDDANAVTILSNIRQAMAPNARLLIIEGVNTSADNVLLQTRAFEQAVWTNGRVRSLSAFHKLVESAGLHIEKFQDTAIFDLSIITCTHPH